MVGQGRCGCEERVETDSTLDGFAGVLIELVFDGERYVLAETALGSGYRLLRFRSHDLRLAYALFKVELSYGGTSRAA